MSRKSQRRGRVATALADNPLEGEQLLLEAMFGERQEPRPPAALPTMLRRPQPAPRVAPAEKPVHYKIVSISLYTEDIDRLDRMVQELKARGHYKANKSQLIRYALTQVDLDKVPKEF